MLLPIDGVPFWRIPARLRNAFGNLCPADPADSLYFALVAAQKWLRNKSPSADNRIRQDDWLPSAARLR
jgi:hypothetical protein